MLTNLWNTIGFGNPTNAMQMFARGVWCLVLAAGWFALGYSATFIGWLLVVIFSFASGAWMIKAAIIVNKVLDDMDAEQDRSPQTAMELILDPERDYVVNPGEPCWFTVGNHSVRIMQTDGGGTQVQVYNLYREDEDPVEEIDI